MLTHGNCIEALRGLPSNSIDACITDPPYGINLRPGWGRNRPIAGDGRSEAKELWAAAVPQMSRLAKDNTAHLFFSAWSETWVKTILEQHFTVKGAVVWVKNNFGLGFYLRPQFEMAYYCHKGKPPRPAKAPSNVWACAKVHLPVHACEKPVPLLQNAIRLTCTGIRRAVILDPFMGVGSTGVAAALDHHAFIGMELDAEYFAVARKRIETAQQRFGRVA